MPNGGQKLQVGGKKTRKSVGGLRTAPEDDQHKYPRAPLLVAFVGDKIYIYYILFNSIFSRYEGGCII